MENPLLADFALGSAQSAASSGPTGLPGSPVKPARNKGGRRSTADEVDRYLAANGLVTVPVGSPAPARPADNPAPMGDAVALVVPVPFDEVGTRMGLEGLLGGADAVAQWQFEKQAFTITKDKSLASEFGKGAAMPAPTREMITKSAVEVCRKHNVSIGPEAGLFAGIAQWGFQLRGLFNDLERIAEVKSKEPGQAGRSGP